MIFELQIRDKNPSNGLLLIEVNQVFAVLGVWGQKLDWAIFDVWAAGDFTGDWSLSEFEEESKGDVGFRASWGELQKLINDCGQFVDALFVGVEPNESNSSETRVALMNKCKLEVEVCDSSYILIRTNDRSLVDHVANKFDECSILKPS